MSHWQLPINFFVALFALIDPVGHSPVFAAATDGAAPAGRRRLAAYIAGFIFAFLILLYLTGLAVLEFFGISLAAFRIAGGAVLFLLGLDMLRGDLTARFAQAKAKGKPPDDRTYARERFESLVVPFAMPLLVGPGAISTVVIYASEARQAGFEVAAMNVGVMAAVSLLTYGCLCLTPVFSRVLGTIGMSLVVRVLGLILCALAVQFIIAGIGETASNLGIIRSSTSPAAAVAGSIRADVATSNNR